MTSILINQLLTPLIFTVFALGFGTIWYTHRRFPSAALFALSYISGALAFGFEAVIIETDGNDYFAFLGDVFYVTTTVFFSIAVYARYEKRPLYEWILPIALGMIAILYWYRFIDHSVEIRSQFVTYGSGIVLLLALPAIRGTRLTSIDRLLFWLIAFFGLQFFVTTFVTLNLSTEELNVVNFSTSKFLAVINFVVSALSLSIAVTLFVKYGMDIITVLQGETQTDTLSGLLNRRGFEVQAKNLISGSGETGKEFILIICDLDNFKSINDQHGHEIGDRAIQAFAKLLQNNVRKSDIVGRVGGEEFCILLPGASSQEAKSIAERCRKEFASKTIEGLPNDHSISASFGVALWRKDDDYQALFRRADQGLYIAKNSGKNRVVPA